MEGLRLFALEFNEKQQEFNYNFGKTEQNTFGWVTIDKYCREFDAEIFLSFLNRIKHKLLSTQFVLKEYEECNKFQRNMIEYNIYIMKSNKKKTND